MNRTEKMADDGFRIGSEGPSAKRPYIRPRLDCFGSVVAVTGSESTCSTLDMDCMTGAMPKDGGCPNMCDIVP